MEERATISARTREIKDRTTRSMLAHTLLPTRMNQQPWTQWAETFTSPVCSATQWVRNLPHGAGNTRSTEIHPSSGTASS